MSTPSFKTHIKHRIEQRALTMQTALPVKVQSWNSSDNTVTVEPMQIETFVDPATQARVQEEVESGEQYIRNVPVCFPRSGDFAITWPIESGSYGLVICTKYALERFRDRGERADPGDLRRFTLNGATFHPVNLYPDSSALSNISSTAMELGDLTQTTQFVALANLVTDELVSIRTAINTHFHSDPVSGTTGTANGTTGSPVYRVSGPPTEADIKSTTVKVSE